MLEQATLALAQGVALAEAGQVEEAVPLLQKAAKLDPANAEAHEMLAQACMEAGMDAAAHQAATAAVGLRPAWPEGQLTLARAARNAGRLQEAASLLESYLALSPAEQEVGEELAEVRQLLQRQVGWQVGLPGLRLEQRRQAGVGPGGAVWEAGALLAWFIVHQRGECCAAAAGAAAAAAAAAGGPGGAPGAAAAAGAGAGAAACCCDHGCGMSTCMQAPGSTADAAPAATAAGSGCALNPHCAVHSRSIWQGASVLELGSGTGVVGLAAACLGAHVVATDLPAVLPLLEANIASNRAMVAAAGGTMRAAALDWSVPADGALHDLAAQLVGGEGGNPQQAQGEEGTADARLPAFDWCWVLGADLLYSVAPSHSLATTVAAVCDPSAEAARGRQARVLIAHKHRHDEVDAALLGTLRQAGVALRALLRDPGSRCTVYGNDAAAEALAAASDFPSHGCAGQQDGRRRRSAPPHTKHSTCFPL